MITLKNNPINVRDSIVRHTFLKSLFMFVLSSFTASAGALIDGVLIGNFLGVDSLSAFGLVNPLIVAFSIMGAIFSTGSRNCFTRFLGRGEKEKAKEIFSVTFFTAVISAVVIMVFLFSFSDSLAHALGARENTAYLLPKTRGYLLGISIGLPAMNGVRVLSSYMGLDNDRNRAYLATVVMALSNIIMGLVVIDKFNGNTFGIGVATSISYYIAFAILLGHFFKKDILLGFTTKKLPWKVLSELISSGLPVGACKIGNTLSIVWLNRMLSVIATSAAVAAFSVQKQVDSILNPFTIGMADTVAMLSGILIGEKDFAKIRKLLKTSFKTTCIVTLGISIIAFFLAPFLASLYIKDSSESLGLATEAVRCYTIGMPLYGLNCIYQNYMQGTGKNRFALVSGIVMDCISLILVAIIMLPILKERAIWYAFPLAQILTLLYYTLFVYIWNKKEKKSKGKLLDKIMLIPKEEKIVKEGDYIDRTIYNMGGVMDLSKDAWDFCSEHGCDEIRKHRISLAVEEMAGNIIQHGFTDGKRHSIDMRIMKIDDDYILRIRDNCKIFNPKKQLQLYSNDDPVRHIGLRMAITNAKEVHYITTLKLNNLVIRL